MTRFLCASSPVLVSSPSLSRRRRQQQQRLQREHHRLHRLKPHRRSSFRSFASSSSKRRSDGDDVATPNNASTTTTTTTTTTTRKPISEWSLAGLLEELQRQEKKAMKKVSQATTRLREAKEIVDRLLLEENDATMEELEKCPDVDALDRDLGEKRARLESVRALSEMTSRASSGGKKKTAITDEEKWKECVELAIELDISDSPPPRPPRGPKKVKNANKNAVRPRRPYFAYGSTPSMDGNNSDNNNETPTEIRVGRTSEDNDIVSLDPTNDPNEWWMHAAGCPGSHVVIKSTAPSDSALLDAALLAAKFSKASQVGRVKVSVVRCRQVSKPKGAKAGLVRLSGDVRTMEVRVDENLDRLDALEKTKDFHF